MKQSPLDLSLCTRKTRKQVFLQQMETVVPWAALVELIAPYYSDGRNGRPPFALETMLRVHFMQQWFSLSDPAMEEAFFDTPLYREFAQLSPFGRLPDESTILRFGKTPSQRHRLEKHKLAERILATVNELLEQRGLLLKAGTAVDADSGLVHTVCGTSGNVSDVTQGNSLLHGQETDAYGDAGYRGADQRPEAKAGCKWHIAMRPGKRKQLDTENKLVDALINKVEQIKAKIRAKVEHPFRVIKCQFGFKQVRYRGLMKNTLQIKTLFALSNLWMVRHKLMGAQA